MAEEALDDDVDKLASEFGRLWTADFSFDIESGPRTNPVFANRVRDCHRLPVPNLWWKARCSCKITKTRSEEQPRVEIRIPTPGQDCVEVKQRSKVTSSAPSSEVVDFTADVHQNPDQGMEWDYSFTWNRCDEGEEEIRFTGTFPGTIRTEEPCPDSTNVESSLPGSVDRDPSAVNLDSSVDSGRPSSHDGGLFVACSNKDFCQYLHITPDDEEGQDVPSGPNERGHDAPVSRPDGSTDVDRTTDFRLIFRDELQAVLAVLLDSRLPTPADTTTLALHDRDIVTIHEQLNQLQSEIHLLNERFVSSYHEENMRNAVERSFRSDSGVGRTQFSDAFEELSDDENDSFPGKVASPIIDYAEKTAAALMVSANTELVNMKQDSVSKPSNLGPVSLLINCFEDAVEQNKNVDEILVRKIFHSHIPGILHRNVPEHSIPEDGPTKDFQNVDDNSSPPIADFRPKSMYPKIDSKSSLPLLPTIAEELEHHPAKTSGDNFTDKFFHSDVSLHNRLMKITPNIPHVTLSGVNHLPYTNQLSESNVHHPMRMDYESLLELEAERRILCSTDDTLNNRKQTHPVNNSTPTHPVNNSTPTDLLQKLIPYNPNPTESTMPQKMLSLIPAPKTFSGPPRPQGSTGGADPDRSEDSLDGRTVSCLSSESTTTTSGFGNTDESDRLTRQLISDCDGQQVLQNRPKEDENLKYAVQLNIPVVKDLNIDETETSPKSSDDDVRVGVPPKSDPAYVKAALVVSVGDPGKQAPLKLTLSKNKHIPGTAYMTIKNIVLVPRVQPIPLAPPQMTPLKAWTSTLGTQTSSPRIPTCAPAAWTVTPGVQISTPGAQTSTQGAQTSTPGSQTAGAQTSTPGAQTSTTGAQTSTPGSQTSGAQTSTPGAQTSTTGTQTSSPGAQTSSTGSQTSTPGSQTSGAQTSTSGAQTSTPGAQTSTPGSQTSGAQTSTPGDPTSTQTSSPRAQTQTSPYSEGTDNSDSSSSSSLIRSGSSNEVVDRPIRYSAFRAKMVAYHLRKNFTEKKKKKPPN